MVPSSPWQRGSTHDIDHDTKWNGSKTAFTPPRPLPSKNHLSRGSPPKAYHQIHPTARYRDGRSPATPSTPSLSSSTLIGDSPPPSPTPLRRKEFKEFSKVLSLESNAPIEAEITLDPVEELCKKVDSVTVEGFSSKYSLQEHQRIARLFMMRCELGQFKGGLLLDMGLGKTIEILARICDAKFVQAESGPTCIVVPAGILKQWEDQIRKFAPARRVLVHHGTRRAQEPRAFESYDIVLVSYETLRSEWSNWTKNAKKNTAMFRASFLRIVLDEGHWIANTKTQQSKACCDLMGKYRWLASGTAINKSEDEMLVYFKFLQVIPENQLGFFYGNSERIAPFRAPFTIGRKKTGEINGKPIVELPLRTIEIIEVDIQDDDEAAFIRGFEERAPVTNDNKYLASQYYKDGPEGPRNGLTMSLRKQQDDGTMSRDARQQVLRSFEQYAKPTVCLVSLKAGGIGLNLNFCNHAIMFNPSWSAVEEDQAFDRLHRIGQVRPVKCYKLIVPGTVEVKILQKQNEKRDVQENAWTAGGPIDGTQSTEMNAKLAKELKKWVGEDSDEDE
ncbi:hypothetical protein FRC05_007675 [Tulasnella sp. 425]|nr:hypothetical protein FRC05_007675 [Tulasnella sp. 425]